MFMWCELLTRFCHSLENSIEIRKGRENVIGKIALRRFVVDLCWWSGNKKKRNVKQKKKKNLALLS